MSTHEQETAAGTDYTVTDAGTVRIGSTDYRVEVQHFHSTGGHMTWLYGPRGTYFLRRILYRGIGDTGLWQVVSFRTSQPLRVRGNEVRVHHIGDMIEVAA